MGGRVEGGTTGGLDGGEGRGGGEEGEGRVGKVERGGEGGGWEDFQGGGGERDRRNTKTSEALLVHSLICSSRKKDAQPYSEHNPLSLVPFT